MDDRARMLPTLPPLAVADVVSRESAFTMTRPPIAVRVTSRAYAWVVPRTMENTSAPDTAPLRIAPAIEIARALASTTWSASASIRTPASVAVIVEPMANAETVLVTVLSDLDRPDAAPAMRLPVPLSSSTEASIPELSRAWTRTPPRVARTTESSRMKASTVAVVWLDECAPASAWASEMVETEMPSAAATEVAAILVVEVASTATEPNTDSTSARYTPARTTELMVLSASVRPIPPAAEAKVPPAMLSSAPNATASILALSLALTVTLSSTDVTCWPAIWSMSRITASTVSCIEFSVCAPPRVNVRPPPVPPAALRPPPRAYEVIEPLAVAVTWTGPPATIVERAMSAEVVVPMSLTAMDLATPAAAPPPAAPLMLAAMAPARALMLEPPVTVLSTISAWVEPLMLLLATDPAPVKEIPAPEPPASPPATPITVDLTVKADFASTATNPPPVTVAVSMAARTVSAISLSPSAPVPAKATPPPLPAPTASASEPDNAVIFAASVAVTATSPLSSVRIRPPCTSASIVTLIVLPVPEPAPPNAAPPAVPPPKASRPARASALMVAVDCASTVTLCACLSGAALPMVVPSTTARMVWSRWTSPTIASPMWLDAEEMPTPPESPPPAPTAPAMDTAPASAEMVEVSCARTVTSWPGSTVLARMLASTVLTTVLPDPEPTPFNAIPPPAPPWRVAPMPSEKVSMSALEVAVTVRSPPAVTLAWSTIARTELATRFVAIAPPPATLTPKPALVTSARAAEAVSASMCEESLALTVTLAPVPVTTLDPLCS